MNPLPLSVSGISETVAAYFLDQSTRGISAGGQEWNSSWKSTAWLSGDLAAWTLMAFLLLTLAVIAGCILALRPRRTPVRPEHELIDEVLRNEDQLAFGPAGSAPPWEKPADWWKND